jgi:hypothetical protein
MELLENNNKEKLKKVIVKTMTVKRSVNDVFNFFNDPKNMESGGVLKFIDVVKDNKDNNIKWWIFDHNIVGRSKIKHIAVRAYGILDHVFIGGGLTWNVFVRVIPNNSNGSTVTWTFIKPDNITDSQFEEQLKGFDLEIESWSVVL